MNADTTIAKNIHVAGEKASYDAACKRLLSERITAYGFIETVECASVHRDRFTG